MGLGDLFVILFFGLVVVSGMFYLYVGYFHIDAFWLGLQVGLLATVLIAINNLRDNVSDRLVNKKTLAVRFGETFAKTEIISFLLLSFLMNLWWFLSGRLWAGLLPLAILPLAIKIARWIWTAKPSPEMNRYLGLSAGLQMVFTVLIAVGFSLS